MVFPVKLMTCDCLLFFIVCSTLASEIFANSECEKNVLIVFPKDKTPIDCFLYALESLNYPYFDNATDINHDARGYFETLLLGLQLDENEQYMTPKQYCELHYEDPMPCIVTLFLYLMCYGVMPALDALKLLYEKMIYKDIDRYYRMRFDRPNPPPYIEEEAIYHMRIMQGYFKYIKKIAKSSSDGNFPTIQQYCESQSSRIRTENKDFLAKFDNKIIGLATISTKQNCLK